MSLRNSKKSKYNNKLQGFIMFEDTELMTNYGEINPCYWKYDKFINCLRTAVLPRTECYKLNEDYKECIDP